jgi:hypothetical protein
MWHKQETGDWFPPPQVFCVGVNLCCSLTLLKFLFRVMVEYLFDFFWADAELLSRIRLAEDWLHNEFTRPGLSGRVIFCSSILGLSWAT